MRAKWATIEAAAPKLWGLKVRQLPFAAVLPRTGSTRAAQNGANRQATQADLRVYHPLQGFANSKRPDGRAGPRSRRGRPGQLILVAAFDQRVNPARGKYDYILVGGGSAGCVLANRLTADGSKSVLLLEAGGKNDAKEISLPAGLPKLFKSIWDWNLYTNKQRSADDRQIYMARGKVLGGSSSTNATLYHRGSASDYDGWGVPGWSAKDVLPFFIDCEDNHEGAKEGVHGVGGPVKVENPRYRNVLHDHFFKAAQEAGLKPNPDFNDWRSSQEGYGEFQVYHDKGQRADMFRQYLRPVLGRSNLTVVTGAQMQQIIFEKQGSRPRARGVAFSIGGPDGDKHSAELSQDGELVLCAGAVHTPQLLQLSGVGPASELRQHGIDVVADLPGVGQNLQDHPASLVSWTTKEEVGPVAVTDQLMHKSGRIRTRAVLNYFLRRLGPLTTTGCDHGAFISTLGDGRIDLQVRQVPALSLDADGVGSYVIYGKLKEQGRKWPTGITFQLLGIRPRSRGSVGLRSDSVFDAPLLNTGFLSDKEGTDLATLRNGIKFSRRVAETPALSSIIEAEVHPGESVQGDDAINDYIRKYLHSGNAITSTCSMGSNAGKGAVVDDQLRVHGVSGLRVVDASVIPVIPGGQTGAAVIMVAERAAAILNGSVQQVEQRQPQLALA